MNAFDAASQAGRAAELESELQALFRQHNRSELPERTRIAATFLWVSVDV